jgi:hypothetical protein
MSKLISVIPLLMLPSTLGGQASRVDDVIRAATLAVVEHANQSASKDGRTEMTQVVWFDRPTLSSIHGLSSTAGLAETVVAEEIKKAGVVEKDDVVECDESNLVDRILFRGKPPPVPCRVKDQGVFISIRSVEIGPIGEARVLLEYLVPTPANRMAPMCPKRLFIELEAHPPTGRGEPEAWRAKKVQLLSAC